MEDSRSEHELGEMSPLRQHGEHEDSEIRSIDPAACTAAKTAEKLTSTLPNASQAELNKSKRFARIEDLATWIPDVSKPAKWTTQRAILLCVHIALSTGVLLMNIGFAASSIYNFQIDSYTGEYFAGNCSSVKVANRWIHLAINVLSSLLLLSSNYCAQILMAPTREEVDRSHAQKDWFDIGVQSLRNWRRIAPKRRVVCTVLMVSSGLLHLMWNSAVFSATPVSYYRVAMVTSDFESDPNPWGSIRLAENVTPNIQEMRHNTSVLDRLNKTACFERYISGSVGMGDLIVVSSNVTMADNQSVISNASTSLLDMVRSQKGSNWIMYNFWMCNNWRLHETGLPRYWCTRDFLEPRLDEWTWQSEQYATLAHEYLYSWYYKIDYCLSDGDNSKEMEQSCALQFSSIVLIAVCVLNLIKVLCIVYTAYIQWQSTETVASANDGGTREIKKSGWIRRMVPQKVKMWWDGVSQKTKSLREDARKVSLVTVGDAVASFLELEDFETLNMDMASMDDFIHHWPDNHEFQFPKETTWSRSASRKKWYLTYSLYVPKSQFVFALLEARLDCLCKRLTAARISLLAIIGVPLLGLELYNLANAGIPIDLASLWYQGLGSFNPFAYAIPQVVERLPRLGQYFLSTLMANIFQVIVSFLYLIYNSLITSLLIADEWNRFLSTRKALRVSTPRSLQRSSYFLSLPLKYSIPLNILNTLLHWLVSQCVFVVASIEHATPDFAHDPSNDAFIIGFSTIAVVLAIVVGAVLFLAPLPLAWFWRLRAPTAAADGREDGDGDEGKAKRKDGFKDEEADAKAPIARTRGASTSSSSSTTDADPVAATTTETDNITAANSSTARLLPKSLTATSSELLAPRPAKNSKSTYPMPLASTCSAAISAACHRHADDVHAHLLPVTWGFVRDDGDGDGDMEADATAGKGKDAEKQGRAGRFCFTTARDVEWPSEKEWRSWNEKRRKA